MLFFKKTTPRQPWIDFAYDIDFVYDMVYAKKPVYAVWVSI
jgi:hypothetical protein